MGFWVGVWDLGVSRLGLDGFRARRGFLHRVGCRSNDSVLQGFRFLVGSGVALGRLVSIMWRCELAVFSDNRATSSHLLVPIFSTQCWRTWLMVLSSMSFIAERYW